MDCHGLYGKEHDVCICSVLLQSENLKHHRRILLSAKTDKHEEDLSNRDTPCTRYHMLLQQSTMHGPS